MKYTLYIMCLFLMFLVASCTKEKTPVQLNNAKVWVLNEGNFMFGNAEITAYNPTSREVQNTLFRNVNGYPLGDVAQSIYVKDTLAFIVVNNSAKIEVVSLPSCKKIFTIPLPGSSPRYLYPVNDSMALVTDLYAGKINYLNLKTGIVESSISGVSTWTERIAETNSFLFVQEYNSFQVSQPKASLLRFSKSNPTSFQRHTLQGVNVTGIVTDKAGKLWVSVQGDSSQQIKSYIASYDEQMNELLRIDFATYLAATNLSLSADGKSIVYVMEDVYTMDITSPTLSANKLINRQGRNIYGIGVDPYRGDIYVADALDFVQSSFVSRYSASGELLHTFNAGIISNNFCFLP